MNFVVASDIPRGFSKEELIKATENDEELQRLITCIREKIDQRDLMKACASLFDELAVADGLVLCGERIVVPRELRETMVKIAHEDIVRTKELLRAHVWFRGIDKMVKKYIGKCLASVDFAGPFPNKDIALVFWDQYSRYSVVEFVTSTFAEAVIPQVTRVFS